jgi:solute carrier family 50 protein (sugar transporter)
VIPFASLLVNCCIWSFYGLLKNDTTVLFPNGLGIFTGGFCFSVYKLYGNKKDFLSNTVVGGLILLAFYLYASGDPESLGMIGCVNAVLLMGSPLATLSTVIREKNTATMPFTTSLMAWGNAVSWSLYGVLIAHDAMVRESSSFSCFRLLIAFSFL